MKTNAINPNEKFTRGDEREDDEHEDDKRHTPSGEHEREDGRLHQPE